MSKTVLVTGGAGYIGAHACKALKQAGYNPVVYDNLDRGVKDAVLWGEFEEGDILDRARLGEVFEKHKPSAVMHFAALCAVGESVEKPELYYRNNVTGTLTLLEAMNDHGIKQFIFSSTCATYGDPQKIPLTEDHPQNPINPYGSSKLMIEMLLNDFETAHGLKHISLRYFNACGCDADGETGDYHEKKTLVIPILCEVALGIRDTFFINGEDYETEDGTCIRDYIHVADLASAHIQALQALQAGTNTTHAYNLGNGQGFSVKEMLEKARKVTGKEIPCKLGPRRAGDPPKLIGDASLARKELGWEPKYTDVEQIIETAWKWYTRSK